jgi:hypothetical protein
VQHPAALRLNSLNSGHGQYSGWAGVPLNCWGVSRQGKQLTPQVCRFWSALGLPVGEKRKGRSPHSCNPNAGLADQWCQRCPLHFPTCDLQQEKRPPKLWAESVGRTLWLPWRALRDRRQTRRSNSTLLKHCSTRQGIRRPDGPMHILSNRFSSTPAVRPARSRLAALSLLLLLFSVHATSSSQPNVVIQWNIAALQGVRDSKLDAPMIARVLPIVHTCMYDAWAAYDEQAVGTQLHDALRCPLASPAQQERVNVAFVDKSLPGSPIGVSGQVSLREAVVGNQVESSWIESCCQEHFHETHSHVRRKPYSNWPSQSCCASGTGRRADICPRRR